MKLALIGIGLAAALAASLTWGFATRGPEEVETPARSEEPAAGEEAKMKTATFGGGCFWCTEAVFEELKGVRDVVSGYAGGTVADPTYQQVCEGTTGHAEVVQITYDPEVVSFADLLEVFWKTHDPTTLNRQGNDVGTQYRSIILYEDEAQKKEAESYKAKLNEAGAFPRPIVTQVVPLERFYPAEAYHQDYYRKNPSQAYCQFVIAPKMEKFRKVFAEKRKESD
jgi:peptide-methionine (S)-S-oxide reductase